MGCALVDKDSGLGLMWAARMAAAGNLDSPMLVSEGGSWPHGMAHVAYGSSHTMCGAGPCLLGFVVDFAMSCAPCYNSACDRCSACDVGSSAAASSVLAGGDMWMCPR